MKQLTKDENTFLVLLLTLCLTFIFDTKESQLIMIAAFMFSVFIVGLIGIYIEKNKE